MGSIIIRIIDLPVTVKGFTVKDENDDYNVYINARLSAAIQGEATRHELEHIVSDHFYSTQSIAEKEKAAKKAGKRGQKKSV